MANIKDNYQISGSSVTELVSNLNFLLQRLADRLDQIEGIRGTSQIEGSDELALQVDNDSGSGTRLVLNSQHVEAPETDLEVGQSEISVVDDGTDRALRVRYNDDGTVVIGDLDLGASQSVADEATQDLVGAMLADTASIDLSYDDSANTFSATVLPAGVDHGGLAGLADDDHTQYPLVAGTETITGPWDFTTNHLDILADSLELRVGAGNDLRLYHDGTNSFIENDTGNLVVRVNGDAFLSEGGLVVGAEAAAIGSRGLEVLGVGGAAFISAVRYGANANPTTLELLKSRNAAVGSHTIVNASDTVGAITAYGSNGTTFDNAASIQFVIDGTPGASADMPGSIDLYTAADASATLTRRWRVRAAGHFQGNSDTERFQAGASQDLEMYHDGTDSVIENNTGNLILRVGGELALEEVTTSTGAVTATLGTNAPAGVGTTTPTTWLTLVVAGTTYFIPLWT